MSGMDKSKSQNVMPILGQLFVHLLRLAFQLWFVLPRGINLFEHQKFVTLNLKQITGHKNQRQLQKLTYIIAGVCILFFY